MTNETHPISDLDQYIAFHNSFLDADETPIDRAELHTEIDPTLKLTAIDDDDDDFANAFHLYFDFDTCAMNLLILLNDDRTIASILISTDTCAYTPMIPEP